MDRFFIGPLNTGLQLDLRPWLIADDAFTTLQNAYVFRGRVRKRFGQQLTGSGYPNVTLAPFYSRVAVQVGTTDGSGDASGTVPGDIFDIGQLFVIGTAIYTVYQLGTPAAMLQTVVTPTATFDTTTGAFVFVGAPAGQPIYWYPAQPIMGLTQYGVGPINDQPAYAFDTQFAYMFNGSYWIRSGSGTTPIWHGGDTNFFWAATWGGFDPISTFFETALFVTNFQVTNPDGAPVGTDDPLWMFDGTTWSIYTPIFLADGSFVQTSLIILNFRNRLILLNTIETAISTGTNYNFVNRCRYTAAGSPFDPNAWIEKNQSGGGFKYVGGGFIDAPTKEMIVGAEFIKDRLIVFFERSTWELAFTGNDILPFTWFQLNTELGSESTFSSIPFDKEILAIGNTGVHACNGSNVRRIDDKIPDEVFSFKDPQSDTVRIQGIRDYYVEMAYWTFCSNNENANNKFPNQVLVYNYKNGSWALNDDCITAFGYFEQATGLLWENVVWQWNEWLAPWNSDIQSPNSRQVIAGNQQGFIFTINADLSLNAAAMSITNMVQTSPGIITLTIINHTLNNGEYNDYIAIINTNTSIDTEIFKVLSIVDANTITISSTFTGTYKGGGAVIRVSNIQIASKEWNPYISKDRNLFLQRIDFCVDRTVNGEITVDYYPSGSNLSMIQGGTDTGAIMGNNVLETFPYALVPLEAFQDRLWHPIYFQVEAETIQIFMYFTDTQMTDPAIAFEDFTLEGLILYTQPTSQRLQ